jgi:predicted  nucleic acid-binding Zn-ribbon protein
MLPSLTSLLALQHLDTAAEGARRRLDAIPGVEAALRDRIARATAAADAAKARGADNQRARRELEAKVAQVDSRLARFDDHKAAVKTNQEFTALLSEIETAKQGKDALEERILILLEEADSIAADVASAEAGVAKARQEGEQARQDLATERTTLSAEFDKLATERKGELAEMPAPLLARYEQLRKNRRGVAVAAMTGEICSACFVRLRPHVVQQIRRNDEIVQCESCQRILYFELPVDA